MSSKDESIEVKIESDNREEKEESNTISIASPEYFMNMIPKKLSNEKLEKYYSQLYFTKLSSIKNLLEIEPKCSSELQNALIFFAEIRKNFYVGAGKILISININKYKTSRYFRKCRLFFFAFMVSKHYR